MLTYTNNTQTANILFRKHGIDIQFLKNKNNERNKNIHFNRINLTQDFVVRHFYAHSKTNILEDILKFADVFMANKDSYEEFLISKGQRDERRQGSIIDFSLFEDNSNNNDEIFDDSDPDFEYEDCNNNYSSHYRDELYGSVCHTTMNQHI